MASVGLGKGELTVGDDRLDYAALWRAIDQPPETLIHFDDDEWFSPHRPADGVTDAFASSGSQMPSPQARFLCNLMAAELASYWWRQRVDIPRAWKARLTTYLADVRHWLNGDLPLAKVARPRAWILGTHDNPYEIPGVEFRNLPRHAIEALQYIEVLFSSFATDHVLYSELPPFIAWQRYEAFIDNWWRRVRCSLAVADAAELQLDSIDGADLSSHLQPDDPWFHFALTMLAWSPVPEAFAPACGLLEHGLPPMEFTHDQARTLSIELLGRLADPAAIPLLRRSLERPLPFPHVPPAEFNWPNQLVTNEAAAAARSLSGIHHADAREALRIASRRSQIGDVRKLATRLIDGEPDVRE